MLLPLYRSEDSAGLPVSFPEGMVSRKPGREPRISPRRFCPSMSLLVCLLYCCMGRKARTWRQAGRVSDVDDTRFCLAPISLACSLCILVLAAWMLENQDHFSCFVTRLTPGQASCLVVSAPRCFVASCASTGIVSQGLARPCSMNLSVSPQTKAKPWWGLQMDAKKWGVPAAFRGKTQYKVAPSYAEHWVFTGLGEIK